MKQKLSQDISETVKNYLNDLDDDYSKKYIGLVVDNRDPDKFGRCKVRVHGLHDGFLSDELPWAIPEFPVGFSTKGSFMVPEIGTVVYVIFDDGDLYEPIYGQKVLDREHLNFEADKDEDYPDSVIFYETSNGDFSKINRAKGEYVLKTGAGVFQKYSENGDIELSNTSTENGDVKMNFRGNFSIDDQLGNFQHSTQKHSVSAFSDVSLMSNGGISTKALDDIEYETNREFGVLAGDRIQLQARQEIRLESIGSKILGNTIEILPSTSELLTTDTEGNITSIPPTFQVSIGNDITKVATMFVTPAIPGTGGCFQALPFDTLTGLPAQGRLVTGIINPVGFGIADTEKTLEIIKEKAKVEAKYIKLQAQFLTEIATKFASIDVQALLIVQGLTGNSIIEDQKALEILNGTVGLLNQKQTELDAVDTKYGNFMVEPIFGYTGVLGTGPEKLREDYNNKLPIADSIAKLDITSKSTGKNILGPGAGIIGE
jgi:hypothetical protein